MDEYFRSYTIRNMGEIGSGGFGYVEKVELFNSFGESRGFCARKTLSPSSSEASEEIKRRFKREILLQAKCVHENVVPIYMCNLNAKNPWFIMDLAECDLQYEIDNNLLSTEGKIKVTKMLLKGVSFIHSKGLYHRDIKPKNILRFSHSNRNINTDYAAKGEYKISDFGLVKNTNTDNDSTQLTRIGVGMGTPSYCAPEIVFFGEYSIQGDIYSIGKVISALDIDIPGIDEIVQKCTQKIKENRYSSVDEISDALQNITNGGV